MSCFSCSCSSWPLCNRLRRYFVQCARVCSGVGCGGAAPGAWWEAGDAQGTHAHAEHTARGYCQSKRPALWARGITAAAKNISTAVFHCVHVFDIVPTACIVGLPFVAHVQVQQLCHWLTTGPGFFEPITSTKALKTMPDPAWVVWSRHPPDGAALIPVSGVALAGRAVRVAAKEEVCWMDIWAVLIRKYRGCHLGGGCRPASVLAQAAGRWADGQR